MRCDDSSPTIQNCLFLRNWASDDGGAMFCNGGVPTIISCQFAENDAPTGAGVCCSGLGLFTITDCTFSANEAIHGGGIACLEDATVQLDNCQFLGNVAYSGAGISSEYAAPELSDCFFSGNEAIFFGGGIFNDNSSVTVDGSTILDNNAWKGGGIFCQENSTAQVLQCTLYRNDASEGSGLCLQSGSHAELANTLITFGLDGESISCEAASGATLDCCDVFGNEGGDWVGCIEDQDGANGNIRLDPLLCDPPNEHFQLQDASPCAPYSLPNPECDLIGAWPVGCDPQALDFNSTEHLASYLTSVRPNPAGTPMAITFSTLAPSDGSSIHAEVFDQSGRLVRVLTAGNLETGRWEMHWNGEDDRGWPVRSGTYLYRVVGGRSVSTGRVTLIR